MYEMLTGFHPFMSSRHYGTYSDKEVIHGIVHEPLQFSSRASILSKSAIRFLQSVRIASTASWCEKLFF